MTVPFMFGPAQPLPGRHPARFMQDTLRNFITGLGTAKDPRTSSHWWLHELDRNVLESAYRSDWLARRLVDLPAQDSTREWRTWQADPKQLQGIDRIEKRLFLRHKTQQAITRARLYGGGALVLGVDVGQPEDELDPDDVGKDDLMFVVVLNRYELAAGPRIYNVMSPYYTRPEYYTVSTPMFGFEGDDTGGSFPSSNARGGVEPIMPNQGRTPLLPDPGRQVTPSYGMIRIHPSRVVEFAGNPLPDWRLAPMGGGWGDSVLQTVDDSLRDFAMIMGGLASVINDMKLDIVSVPELSRHLGTDDATQKFIQRWTLANQAKSTINTLLIDENEKWQRIQTSFGGTSDLIRVSMQVACAAGGVPMSRVMGMSPNTGLGTEGGGAGEVDLRAYYDDLANMQKTEYRQIMYMLDRVIVASATGDNDEDIDYQWNPLYQKDPSQEADVALKKAQATQIYIGLGLINEDAMRDGVASQLTEDKTYPALEQAIEKFGVEPEEPPAPPPPAMLPTPPPGMLNKGQFDPNPFHMLRAQAQAKAGMPIRVPPNPPRRPPIPAPTSQSGKEARDFDPREPRDRLGKWTAAAGARPEAIATQMNAELGYDDVADDKEQTASGMHHYLYSRSGHPDVEAALQRHLSEAGHAVDVQPDEDLEWVDEPEEMSLGYRGEEGLEQPSAPISVPIAAANRFHVVTKDGRPVTVFHVVTDFNPYHDPKSGRFTSKGGTAEGKAAAARAAATHAKRSEASRAAHARRKAQEAEPFKLPEHATPHQAGVTAVARTLHRAKGSPEVTKGEVGKAAREDIKQAVEEFAATRHLKEPKLPEGVSADQVKTGYRTAVAVRRFVTDPESRKVLAQAITRNSISWAATKAPSELLTVAHHGAIDVVAEHIGGMITDAVIGGVVGGLVGGPAGGVLGAVAGQAIKTSVHIGLDKLAEATGFTPEHIKHLCLGCGAALKEHYQKWKAAFGHLTQHWLGGGSSAEPSGELGRVDFGGLAKSFGRRVRRKTLGRGALLPNPKTLERHMRRHPVTLDADEGDPIEQALSLFDEAVQDWQPKGET